jgi:hypothetical protein
MPVKQTYGVIVMKYNRILILALAGLILAVICSGNALAYTWDSQSDVTQLTSSNSAQ